MNVMKTITLYLITFCTLLFLPGCMSSVPIQESPVLEHETFERQNSVDIFVDKSDEKRDEDVNEENSKLFRNCFKTSKIKLEKSCKDEIKEFLSQTSLRQKRNIIIEVHTDKSGDDKQNLSISKKRALEVASSLYYKEYKFSKVYHGGFGEDEVLRNSETQEDNLINRRVKITLKDKYANVDTNRYKLYIYKKASKDKRKKIAKLVAIDLPNRPEKVDLIRYTGKADTGWIYFGKAELAEKLNINCTEDKPRQVRRVATKGHAKEEFFSNAYNKNLQGNFGKYSFRMAPISVFDNGDLPTQNPNILLFESKTSPKALTTIVNSYCGEKGMLYRVFINKKNSATNDIECMDIVLPYKSSESLFGVAYFKNKKSVIHEEFTNILYK